MIVDLVVATTENGVIGLNGEMPWRMSADLNHFKNITTLDDRNVVIMGRKTYDSIGKKLPGRENIIITTERDKNKTSYIDGIVINSIQEAFEQIRGWEYFLKKEYSVHVIGGSMIYEQVMKMGVIDKIHHTLIHTKMDGDAFFNIPDNWIVVNEKPYLSDEENVYDYTFRVLTKIQDL